MLRFFSWVISSAMLLGIVGIVVVMLVIKHYGENLPDISSLQHYDPPVVSRVHAGDGRLMAEFAAERRVFVPVNRIPQRVIDAFLSAEDKTFYEHSGIDPRGILGAVITNIENMGSGRHPVGASTITQQVAKNFLVGNEASYVRKIREALIAFRIEEAFSKDEILELYLNQIFLGQRAYGVGSAALAYFNKTLDELTIAEAAYLAALPKAPNSYNPVTNREGAMARRNYVLQRMLEDGKITQAEYDHALTEPIEMRPRAEGEFYRGGDYFTEEVRRELVARFGEDKVLRGGLLVRATIDPRLQDLATQALRQQLISYDRDHGWRGPVARIGGGQDLKAALALTPMPGGGELWHLAVVTDTNTQRAEILLKDGAQGLIPLEELKWARLWKPGPSLGPAVAKVEDVLKVGDIILVEKIEGDKKFGLRQIPAVQGGFVAMDANTGRVLAMVGGFSPRMSSFNRATQAWRQPGSSFKPFVYMAALEAGFTPSSLVLDAPISLPQGPGMPAWTPGNYSNDYLGPTTLRVGMEKSRNVMTVRLAQQVGIDNVAKMAEAFGVVDSLPHNLSMALGAGETTVLRQVTAYAEIVNGARRVTPTLIDSVQDKEGHILYKHDDRPCQGCQNVMWRQGLTVPNVPDTRPQIIDPRTAYQMTHILEGVIQRGTGTRAKGLPWPVAGKTGTTNDERDAWFVGFSSDMSVGLYIGFDQPTHLGDHMTGGILSTPVFKTFMEGAMAGTPPVPFRVPPGLRLVRVNPATGRLADPSDDKAIWEAYKPGTEPRPGSIEATVDPAIDWNGADTEVIRMPSANTGTETAAPPAVNNQGNALPSYLPPPDSGNGAEGGAGAGDGFGGIY